MADKLTLEVLVKTVLDAAGVKAGTAEIKQLTSTIEGATQAGKQLEVTSDSIVSGLEKQRAAAMQTGKAWEDLSAAEKEGQQETARRAVRMLEAEEAAKKLANSSQNLAKDLGTLKMAGSGVQQVIGGALTGNFVAVGQGLATLGKAAETATKGMQALFAQLTRGAAAGAAIGAPLLVAIKAVEMYAADLEKANKRILDSARDTSERRKKIMADETAAIVADYAKQVTAANEAATAAEEAQKRTEAAYARAAKKTDASREQRDANLDIEEKNALGSARTDADRERIKRDFARRRGSNQAQDKLSDFNTSDYQGQVQANEAQRAIDDAIARNRDAQAGVGQAEIDYQNKQSAALSYKATDTSAAAVSARKAALDARDRVATLKGEAGKVETETSKTIQVNQAIIDQAKDTKEIVAIQREILKATLAQQSKEARKAGDSESKKDASSIDKVINGDTPTAPEKPGNILGEITKDGKTVVVNRDASGGAGITSNGERVITDKRTIVAIGEAQQTMETVLTVFGQFAGAVTDKGQKLATNLQNERERSGGG